MTPKALDVFARSVNPDPDGAGDTPALPYDASEWTGH